MSIKSLICIRIAMYILKWSQYLFFWIWHLFYVLISTFFDHKFTQRFIENLNCLLFHYVKLSELAIMERINHRFSLLLMGKYFDFAIFCQRIAIWFRVRAFFTTQDQKKNVKFRRSFSVKLHDLNRCGFFECQSQESCLFFVVAGKDLTRLDCYYIPQTKVFKMVTKVHSLSIQLCTRIVFINWQLMSALASLERFGEEDPFFINWRSCRHCLQSEWPLGRFKGMRLEIKKLSEEIINIYFLCLFFNVCFPELNPVR